MRIYLDSSVALRYLLSGDESIRRVGPGQEVASSELLEIECKRVLQRERLEQHIDDARYAEAIAAFEELGSMLAIIEIGGEIKRRAAGSFPTVIGTLDAIHLATALLWQEEGGEKVFLWSLDRQLALCAGAMGIPRFSGA
jgi:predicted nucleic acid-binding protein